jgi:hypothetical protein
MFDDRCTAGVPLVLKITSPFSKQLVSSQDQIVLGQTVEEYAQTATAGLRVGVPSIALDKSRLCRESVNNSLDSGIRSA